MEIFGIPLAAMMSQLLLGLVNGSFYAILSLGLAVIFGLLNVINFAHGALFMLGAMLAWMGYSYFNVPYWAMLVLAPVIVGLFGVVVERSIATPNSPTISGASTSITQYGRLKYDRPIQVSIAPSMNNAPCAKLITLSRPKITAKPRLRIA